MTNNGNESRYISAPFPTWTLVGRQRCDDVMTPCTLEKGTNTLCDPEQDAQVQTCQLAGAFQRAACMFNVDSLQVLPTGLIVDSQLSVGASQGNWYFKVYPTTYPKSAGIGHRTWLTLWGIIRKKRSACIDESTQNHRLTLWLLSGLRGILAPFLANCFGFMIW